MEGNKKRIKKKIKVNLEISKKKVVGSENKNIRKGLQETKVQN